MGLEQRIFEKLERKQSERQEIINEIERVESEVSNRGAKALGGTAQFGCLGIIGINLIGLGIGLFVLGSMFPEAIIFGFLAIFLAIMLLVGANSGNKRVVTASNAARQIKESKTRLANIEKEINQIRTLIDP